VGAPSLGHAYVLWLARMWGTYVENVCESL
jgi:hypothetical protein